MLTTLTSKFTFFFWFIFFTVVTFVYLFSTLFLKDMLQTLEKEKVALMVNTTKSTLAINISLEQNENVKRLLKTILNEKNILSIKVTSEKINITLTKKQKSKAKVLSFQAPIQDPFSSSKIADIEIKYSNENLLLLYNKSINTLLLIFTFTLFMFLTFYLFIKKELNTLAYISKSLQNFSSNQELSPIKVHRATDEITTITTAANAMIESISKHVTELKNFNTTLEQQVQDKVQKIHAQEKLLVHQSRQAAMGEMIESIAHQWRQPLNIIGLSASNLEISHAFGKMSDDNFKENINTILLNIGYMSDTIDDFRDFLNPNNNMYKFNPQKTIKDVFNILKAQLTNNDISLTINVEEEIEFLGNENEFKQVIFILINNSKDAIKSLQQQEKSYKGEIKISLTKSEQKNSLTFCDNGGGIKSDIIHSIFNPYFSTKFSASGTGIGLYMAKNIIESRMEASISVKNIKNGCCFTIEQEQNRESLT